MNAFRKLVREGEQRLAEEYLAKQRAEWEWDNLSDKEREGERAQAGDELASMQHRAKRKLRDIVDMVHDDALTQRGVRA